MSRHLWNASRPKPENQPDPEPEPQHLGIFAATIRTVKGLTGRATPEPDPAAVLDDSVPSELDLPVPRSAPEGREPPVSNEEITVELPRYHEVEPADPALSMLSRGRHGL